MIWPKSTDCVWRSGAERAILPRLIRRRRRRSSPHGLEPPERERLDVARARTGVVGVASLGEAAADHQDEGHAAALQLLQVRRRHHERLGRVEEPALHHREEDRHLGGELDVGRLKDLKSDTRGLPASYAAPQSALISSSIVAMSAPTFVAAT
jgi:hypothetical protein